MRTLLITLFTIMLASSANAQFGRDTMLGLERAVRVNGTPCLMTTPYDLSARCGVDRVVMPACAYPVFEGPDYVCYRSSLDRAIRVNRR